MKNIRLTIEYDGADYHGWQVQANGPTIQEVIENGLGTILREKVRLTSSGRTDAGVHALGQVANFKTSARIEPKKLFLGLNALLPDDIVIKKVEEAPPGFDARRSAKSKIYRYVILNRKAPSALERNRCWHIWEKLDIDLMRKGAKMLIGKHDFSSFRASGCAAKDPVRKVLNTGFFDKGDGFIYFDIEGQAFLRHMVRTITGTLVGVGLGKIAIEELGNIIDARDRRAGGVTAPAKGLFLLEVKY